MACLRSACQLLAVIMLSLIFKPVDMMASNNSASPFSAALKNRRMYDTSLQSSIIRLIKELMLTPKVYEMVSSGRRADSGLIFFPEQSSSSSSYTDSRTAKRVTDDEADTNRNKQIPVSSRSLKFSRGRPGTVERVHRPIILNGNAAAAYAPKYNRMLEGPAPTVGAVAIPPIPQPSVIMSQPLRVLEGDRDSRGRSLKEIDVQGVRVIVGERVPDDPEDKLFTYRNGRFIKGMFIPNEASQQQAPTRDTSNLVFKPSSVVVSSAYSF